MAKNRFDKMSDYFAALCLLQQGWNFAGVAFVLDLSEETVWRWWHESESV